MFERLKKAAKRPTPEEVGPVNFGDSWKKVRKFAKACRGKWVRESDYDITYAIEWFDDGNIYEVNFHFEPDPDDFNNPSKDWLSNIGLTFEEKLTEEEYSLLEQEKFVPRM